MLKNRLHRIFSGDSRSLHGGQRHCALHNPLKETMKNKILTALLLAACAAAHAEDNVLTFGAGIAAAPRYSGSDEYVAAPLIAIDYQMANGFFASTMRGIGYGWQAGPVHLSAALGYRGQRSEKNRRGFGGASGSAALRGMGDIEGSATAVLSGSWAIVDGLELGVNTDLPLSHHDNGRTLGIGLTGTLFKEQRDLVTLGLSATVGDGDYMRTYYGVSAAQAARTTYKAYTPKAGLYQAQVALTWRHAIDERWSVTGTVGAVTLVRDAARSPITLRDRSAAGAVYAAYAF